MNAATGRRGRSTWLVVIVIVVLAITAIVLLRPRSSAVPLDPTSPAPEGTLALANLLAQRGTDVQLTRSFDEAAATGADRTLLLVDSRLLSEETAAALLTSDAARIVIVGPGPLSSSLGLKPAEPPPAQPLAADCDIEAAARAGEATFTGLLDGPGNSCFEVDGGAGLHQVGNRVVLSADTPLLNENLAESGNAALGINLLSQSGPVTWYLPDANDPALLTEGSTPVLELLPTWVFLLVCQGLLLFVAAVFIYARRLGPLVREELPVLVSAHETDVGLANLWQQQQSYEQAANHLRDSAWSDVEATLGPGGTQLLRSRAAELTGKSAAELKSLFDEPVSSAGRLQEVAAGLAEVRQRIHTGQASKVPPKQ